MDSIKKYKELEEDEKVLTKEDKRDLLHKRMIELMYGTMYGTTYGNKEETKKETKKETKND